MTGQQMKMFLDRLDRIDKALLICLNQGSGREFQDLDNAVAVLTPEYSAEPEKTEVTKEEKTPVSGYNPEVTGPKDDEDDAEGKPSTEEDNPDAENIG